MVGDVGVGAPGPKPGDGEPGLRVYVDRNARCGDAPAHVAWALDRASTVQVCGPVPSALCLWASEPALASGLSLPAQSRPDVLLETAPIDPGREGATHVGARRDVPIRAAALLTRPWADLREEALDLEAEGIRVFPWPLTTQGSPPDPGNVSEAVAALMAGQYDAVAFMSARAVAALVSAFQAGGGWDLRRLAGTVIAAVGEATRLRLRHLGIEADVVGAGGGQVLAPLLLRSVPAGGSVLIVGAAGGRRELETALKQAGRSGVRCDSYAMVPSPLTEVTGGWAEAGLAAGNGQRPVYLECMSPGAAVRVASKLGTNPDLVRRLRVIAVGSTTEAEGRRVLPEAHWIRARAPAQSEVRQALLTDLERLGSPDG